MELRTLFALRLFSFGSGMSAASLSGPAPPSERGRSLHPGRAVKILTPEA